MHREIGRRTFVGTVIAGVPLLVGGPSLLAQSKAATPASGGGRPLDPFIEYTVRELAAIQRRAHERHQVRGEDARAAAQQLRAVTVYTRGLGLDAAVTQALRSTIDSQGRDALMYPNVEPRQVVQDMRQFGFEIDDLPDVGGVDYVTRAALLDDLSKAGITPALLRIADTLARASAELDRRAAMVATPLVRVQDSSWWSGFCSSLQSTIQQMQAEAGMLYVLAWFFPDLWGAYYLYQAGVYVDEAIYAAACAW